VAAAIVVLLGTRPSRAAQAARLVYGKSSEAAACAEETALRQAVARRLGYDPFVTYATRTMVVELRGDPNGLKARLYVVEADNAAGGARELTSAAADCRDLIAAVALAISIAIDPDAADRANVDASDARAADATQDPKDAEASHRVGGPDPAPASGGPLPTSASPTPFDSHAASSGRERSKQALAVVGVAGVGGAIASGPAPAPNVQLWALAGIRGEHWRVTLEPRIALPSSSDVPAGSAGPAKMTYYGVTLAPCYRYGGWLGCYVLDAGLAVSTGEVAEPRTDQSFWWAQGLRAAFRWNAAPRLGIAAELDGLLAMNRIALRIDGRDAFETPGALVRFGTDVDYEF